jgi:hypothetical protein
VQGSCLKYYQDEGKKLYHWDSGQGARSVCDKLRKRRAYLKKFVEEAGTYEENLAKALSITCFRCKIRGPLLSANEHKMFVSHTPQGMQWACSKCREGDERHEELVSNAIERARTLGTPGEYDDTMKKVVVVDQRDGIQRVVFVPACIATDQEDAEVVSDAELNPRNTTVLVPKNSEALEQIGDEASERANTAKNSLEQVAEFFGRRLLFGSVTESVSVFYRLKIAQIRLERLSMLTNMKSTSKGKVVSRVPPMAVVKERNPHFAMTQQFCLTNTCNWSPSAQEKRAQESAARANVNGCVKIKVDMTVLKNLAVDSPHLKDIISETLHCLSPTSLVSTAPIALNYLKAKVDLLVKHVISQSYQNWDLELRFSEQEWTVQMVGFLYCKEFEEINEKIARGEATEDEVLKEAKKYQHLLPTTTTSKNRLMEDYSIAEKLAEVSNCISIQNQVEFFVKEIVALAEQHQKVGETEPISLLTIYTPSALTVSEAEFALRGRAVQLGNSFGNETSAVDAITQIMEVLRQEGLDEVYFQRDHLKRISDELLFATSAANANHGNLVLYHTLLWKTGGDEMWTLQRSPSDCEVVPYIPALLGTSRMAMSAKISSSEDHLLPKECLISEELKAVLKDYETKDNWQEISILEFINATLPSSKVPPASGPTSQAITQVITTKDRKLTWRVAQDSDNETGELIFESEGNSLYVRTDSDVRKLYEGRPERMQGMALGEFASEYRLLKPSDNGFESAKNSIDEQTDLGPNSSDLVAGMNNTFAPKAMRLANDKIMKRRMEGKAVPHLLFSGMMSKHGSQLMWSPWQNLEDVTGQQDEMETAEQRRTRLQIFPLSSFPHIDEDSDSDNENLF